MKTLFLTLSILSMGVFAQNSSDIIDQLDSATDLLLEAKGETKKASVRRKISKAISIIDDQRVEIRELVTVTPTPVVINTSSADEAAAILKAANKLVTDCDDKSFVIVGGDVLRNVKECELIERLPRIDLFGIVNNFRVRRTIERVIGNVRIIEGQKLQSLFNELQSEFKNNIAKAVDEDGLTNQVKTLLDSARALVVEVSFANEVQFLPQATYESLIK